MVSNATKFGIILIGGLLLGFIGWGIILTVMGQKEQIVRALQKLVVLPNPI